MSGINDFLNVIRGILVLFACASLHCNLGCSVVEAQVHDQNPRIVQVTDYGDYLPGSQRRAGSLRAALEGAQLRDRITFAKPGTIQLLRPLDILVNGIHIDGTSNPVVIIGDVIRIKASNITLSHLWIFAGDEPADVLAPGYRGHSLGSDRDAIVIWGAEKSTQSPRKDILIDHCWIGFAVDECLSTYGAVENVRITNSIIGFGLNRSIHPKDKKRSDVPGHGKGVLIGLKAKNVSFSGNLLVHNFDRNIQVRGQTDSISFVGNVVYNWGRGNAFNTGDAGSLSSGVVIGNVYVAGKDSFPRSKLFRAANAATAAQYSVAGNIGPVSMNQSLEDPSTFQTFDSPIPKQFKLQEHDRLINSPAQFAELLSIVGPHPILNDKLSALALKQVLTRTGGVIDFFIRSRNSEASVALGFEPLLEELVERAALKDYSFVDRQRRPMPSR